MTAAHPAPAPLPLSLDPANPFAGPGGPRPEDLSRCVHCGLCLNSCPTYVELGIEMESPRGRIALIRAVQEGRTALTSQVEEHLDLCLQCRACEAVCPSGVPYGRIMEDARAAMQPERERRPAGRLQKLLLRQVIARKRVLAVAFFFARLYRRLRIGAIIERVPLLPKRLKNAAAVLPPRIGSGYPERGRDVIIPAKGTKRGRVAMLSGCVMSELYGATNAATARVLAENGYEVVIPGAQVCCGALHLHNGDREGAKSLARRNLRPFLETGAEALVVNSAGCGSTLKEYGELLHSDPNLAPDAARLAAMTRDVSEFLAGIPLRPAQAELPWKVTYQDSCHLAHAQRIKSAPRAVLAAIPGLDLREMETPDRCCGSAGIYSLLQPEMSQQLLESKMDDAVATGAGIIVTANPGCMLQLDWGARRRRTGQRVLHVVDVLDAAYCAERQR
jgi:glycolate oxidase iron-sulfur subunit